MVQDGDTEIGFVEVQQRTDKLNQICDVKYNDKVMIAVMNERGKVIYSSWKLFSKVLINHYRNIGKSSEKQTITADHPFSKLPETISYQHSDYTGWTVFIIQNREELLAPLKSVRYVTILAIFGITVVSILVLSIFVARLAHPLKHLKEEMEKVNMDNLPGELQVEKNYIGENNEIDALNNSFHRMRERLNQAVNMEIKSRSLQLKAHFDALQSQINPHFLYNILGVIPAIGDEDEILNACLKLADMLRYSTSNINAKTTIKDEITHTSNYLTLMKKRFEHRLEYAIEVDGSIYGLAIPKLVIQPLVENSISHGFDSLPQPVMKILISGYVKGSEWHISIRDNGSGFEEDVLERLQTRIKKYTDSLLSNEKTEELEIGGMGLINTFARLLLFYGQQLKFELKNGDSGGACIDISASLSDQELEGGNRNV